MAELGFGEGYDAALAGMSKALVTAEIIGANRERQRFIKLLTDLGVIRDSLLGDEWQVIYTETGAMDITWKDIKAENK